MNFLNFRFMDPFFAKPSSAFILGLLVLSGLSSSGTRSATAETEFPKPYRMENSDMRSGSPEISLNKTANLPDWASVEVQHRSRFETLDNPFRARATGGDQVLSQRTLVQGELRFSQNFKLNAELQDSRAQFADSATLLNNTMVDAAELLETNLQWNAENLFGDGSKSVLRVGRLTMDVENRRLVARNRFRNTLNSFSGLDWIWQAGNGNLARLFYTLPIDRLPDQRNQIANNVSAIDRENIHRRFWGFLVSSPNLPWGNKGEFYLFGLNEEDAPNLPTLNRNIYTPGMRIFRPTAKGGFDYELSSNIQFGTSRATVTDTRDLDHFAHLHHAETGYTFAGSWSPRFLLEYDYASGDADSRDGKNGAFDALYGKATEYSPSSIYSAFVRTNLSGPGIRLETRPDKTIKTLLSYRPYWLAESTGAWAGASGLQDITGQSSSFLGHQTTLQAKWQVLPNLLLDGGVTYLREGDFQKTVPNAPREGNTIFAYIAATISF